eukprot:scaffold4533_cov93-Skeletonema_dohrnii-CCMP3373.AAC.1
MAGLQHDTIDGFSMQSSGRQTCSARSQDGSTLKLRSAPYPLTIWSLLMSKIAAVLAKAVRLMTRSYVTLYRKVNDTVSSYFYD